MINIADIGVIAGSGILLQLRFPTYFRWVFSVYFFLSSHRLGFVAAAYIVAIVILPSVTRI